MEFENLLYQQNLSNTALEFLESSKLKRYEAAEYGAHVSGVMGTPILMQQIKNHSVERSLHESIPLEEIDPEESGKTFQSLAEMFAERKSTRNFTTDPMRYSLFSRLLFSACHYTHPPSANLHGIPQDNAEVPRRNIPSGGGLFPGELYVLILNVQDINPGLYHYCTRKLALEKMPEGGKYQGSDISHLSDDIFFAEQRTDIDFKNASAILIHAARFNRAAFKYRDRGVRYAYLEAGCVMQNLYLACAAEKAGCVACGGFYDDDLIRLLDMDNLEDGILNVMVIGNPKPEVSCHG